MKVCKMLTHKKNVFDRQHATLFVTMTILIQQLLSSFYLSFCIYIPI